MKKEVIFTITEKNRKVIETYAKYKKQTINQFINEAISEKIEDIYGSIKCNEILHSKYKTKPYEKLRNKVFKRRKNSRRFKWEKLH